MADFERLIRKALASQDAGSADVRKVVYQSSRNALQKIIDGNRSLTVENAMAQKKGLEDCIEKIEQEYLAPPPPPPPVVEQPPEPVPEPVMPEVTTPAPVAPEPVAPEPQRAPAQSAPEKPSHPLDEIQQILAGSPSASGKMEPSIEPEIPPRQEPQVQMDPVAPQPEPVQAATPEVPYDPVLDDPALQSDLQAENRYGASDELYEQPENVPLGFQKRRKTQKRIFWTIINLIVLALLGWIIYIVATSFLSGSLFEKSDGSRSNPNNISQQGEADSFINILDAGDTTTLDIAGRGRAEIVNQLNTEMIRINSTRDELNRGQPAEPILIKLNPGVLQQISGKRVTVELFAKSGGGEQAHFAVGCEFGALTDCGRKRFLAGPQPSASVFAFQMDPISDTNQDMFLTLSTDTTGDAAVSGSGDILDIVYVRLSVDE